MRQHTKLVEDDREVLRKSAVARPLQSAAICWRLGDSGNTEVLLITSRDTGRWVLPKGNIEKGEARHKCALREAREEAGVVGRVGKIALGYFSYLKQEDGTSVTVSVHLLQVVEELDDFPERHLRRRAWMPAREAASRVREPAIKQLLELLAEEHIPRFIAEAKKNKRDRKDQ